jgi:hypothetical protein
MTPTMIELPVAGRFETTSGGGRSRNIIKGEGMVTPTKSLTLNDPYTGEEVLEPGRHRLSPEHPAVQRRPEWFRAAMKGDKATADRMRDLLGRVERDELRAIERMRGGRTASRPRSETWRLPDAPREIWRLP